MLLSFVFYNPRPVQLAVGTGEHPLAAAPVHHAEGGHAGVLGAGEGGPARPGALLRRLGPHAADRSTGQGPAGPLLQNHRGESLPLFRPPWTGV